MQFVVLSSPMSMSRFSQSLSECISFFPRSFLPSALSLLLFQVSSVFLRSKSNGARMGTPKSGVHGRQLNMVSLYVTQSYTSHIFVTSATTPQGERVQISSLANAPRSYPRVESENKMRLSSFQSWRSIPIPCSPILPCI